MFCFTSRIARKSDPVHVGRSIFVNVMYEYHYKIMNLINSISRFPPCPRMSLQLWLAKPLVILAPHSSLYFCTDPHCQTAGLPSPTIILHTRHQAAMAYVEANCTCTLSKPHPLIYIYESNWQTIESAYS